MAGPRQTSADKAATPAVEIDGARVLVVEARFYDNYADELLAGALAVLEEAGCRVDVVTVPGALEIPSAIVIGLRAADEAVDPYEAVVALGTVIRGETGHYDIVAGESSRALMDLSVAFALPLGNGILTVENEAQAWARANRADMNKGGGAAEAALAVLRYKRSLAEPSQ
jgi:6,7-dimethyl-8-ribityllumazine synthase